MDKKEILQWAIDAHVMIGTNNNEGEDEGKCLLGALIRNLKTEVESEMNSIVKTRKNELKKEAEKYFKQVEELFIKDNSKTIDVFQSAVRNFEKYFLELCKQAGLDVEVNRSKKYGTINKYILSIKI